MIFLSNIEKKTYLIYLDHSRLTCETCKDKFINRNVIHEKYNDKKKTWPKSNGVYIKYSTSRIFKKTIKIMQERSIWTKI